MDALDGRPVHIALNAHLLSGGLSYRSAGVHQYIHHLLAHLPQAGCQITAFLGPESVPPKEVTAIHSRWPTQQPAVRAAWEQFSQPWMLLKAGVDLIHGPAFVGPLVSSVPLVITIHDLSFMRFPHLFRRANRLYLKTMTWISVRQARQVIAVSHHAAEETVNFLHIPPEKIVTVYHGVDPEFQPLPKEQVEAFRARKGLSEQFILHVGTLEPRKNLIRLVKAFARLQVPNLKLVLAGGRGWYDQEIFDCVAQLNLQQDVVFAGYVPGQELEFWYNAASIFAYPSLYEGFGMPVLEAQACGTPVLTSNLSALPEAAGDGALMVDPNSVEAIADGLDQLLNNNDLRETIRQRGLDHAANFTWQKTAAETLAVYKQALARGGQV